MEITKYSFGKFVRERREKNGISLRQMAVIMQISAPYLSNVENGLEPAPLKIVNGKDRMRDFIRILKIKDDEISLFYELAYATRKSLPDIDDYLLDNYNARKTLLLAKESGLPNEEWDKIIDLITSFKKNSNEEK